MAYCTESDIIEAIGQRAVVQSTANEGTQTINSTRLASFIANADAEINTYFVTCANLPIGPIVPTVIKDLSIRLTVYQCLRRNNQANITDGVKAWRDDAIAQLKLLNGKCYLLQPMPDGPTDPAAVTGNGLRVQSSTKIFDDDRLAQMPQ